MSNRGKLKAGSILGAFVALLQVHGAIRWKFLTKLGATQGQSWWQVATEMGHDSFKMSHDSGKISSLNSTWELLLGVFLGAFFD